MNKASEFIKKGQVKLIYKDSHKKSFEANGYHVTITKRAGRQTIECSCTNHSKFPNGLCSHKRAAITMDTMQGVDYD